MLGSPAASRKTAGTFPKTDARRLDFRQRIRRVTQHRFKLKADVRFKSGSGSPDVQVESQNGTVTARRSAERERSPSRQRELVRYRRSKLSRYAARRRNVRLLAGRS